MDLSAAHIGFMLATVALVLGGGIYAARSVKSAEGYSLGGRAAGAPMVAGTIAGTVIGGSATVGTAQMAFSVGLSAWWFTHIHGAGSIDAPLPELRHRILGVIMFFILLPQITNADLDLAFRSSRTRTPRPTEQVVRGRRKNED